MSGKSILTIYGKEMLELSRDRRTLISMIVVPLAAIPVLFMVMSYFMTAREKTAESEAVTVAVQANLRTPGLAAALRGAGMALVTVSDVREAVGKKQAAAGVEEGARATGEPEISIYEDKTRQASGIAGDKVRIALDGLKADKVREALNGSGVSEKVLSPFFVKRVNVAAGKKMAGFVFGSIVGYTVILLMFSTCMYPSIDMTAGEKERRTLEALLCSPAQREEIVLGKILAATTAAFGSALLTVSSLILSFRFMPHSSRAGDAFLTAVPFTPKIIALVLLALLPTAGVAAAVMIAISAFAKSFKEGQSYLGPLIMLVVFPAVISMLPGMELNMTMALIPVFNVSQLIKEIFQGAFSLAAFAVTLAANTVYAAIAFYVAVRVFKNEKVLFRV